MHILANAVFLAQCKGIIPAIRYAYRFGVNADRVVVLTLGAIGLPCIAVDILRVVA